MEVGGWWAGCCTVAVFFSEGQNKCCQWSPLGQDVIWSECLEETFDICRNASI